VRAATGMTTTAAAANVVDDDDDGIHCKMSQSSSCHCGTVDLLYKTW